ncbi:transmembrane protein 70 homolog, mitochondrial [Glossina fuscipes]|uniref:Transmembrane protein 70 homolog, mitochondrial n=1 Tax=Glossina fuscipes TaxID=7396 RepID=A0A9C5ZCK5_9MUSC|nr:transmembrane protein 70 homolog, mitochondrial [Glossina fuscipes]
MLAPRIISCTAIGIRRLGYQGFHTRKISNVLLPINWNCSQISRQYKKNIFAKEITPDKQHKSKCFYATQPENNNDINSLQCVYCGSLNQRMRAVKILSLTTSLVGLAAQPILMEQSAKLGGTALAIFICGFAGFFTFVTPLLLHFITKKYVTEIYYNPKTEEYVATTISILMQKIQTKFRPIDVKVPEVPGMFTSFFVGKKALFVDPSMFDNPEHYVRIMGYDKPVDFKLDLEKNKSDRTQ